MKQHLWFGRKDYSYGSVFGRRTVYLNRRALPSYGVDI